MHRSPQRARAGFGPRGRRPGPSSVSWAAGSAFGKKLWGEQRFGLMG